MNSKRTTGMSNMQSPFRLPNDEGVFIFRESEKQKKLETKKKNKNKRIWDKKTASCRNPKVNFSKNFIDEDELREEIEASRDKKKKRSNDEELVNRALDIVR